MPRQTSASVSADEIARFSAVAAEWWEPEGSFRFLHQLNPLRMDYVRTQVAAHRDCAPTTPKILKGQKLLDVGCGGGLLAEKLAEAGANVTGIDASEATIAVAKAHAAASGLEITYALSDAEALAKTGAQFDIITAFEVVEHVANIASFVQALSKMLKPNGLLIMATVNRTVKSYMLGIVAAEYVLGWVPVGTHDWERFVKPSELVTSLDAAGLTTVDLTGVVFDPLTRRFAPQAHKLDVNYLLTARKA